MYFKKYAAFSLLEMLIVLSILASSLLLALPHFSHALSTQNLEMDLQLLKSRISYARVQALETHENIVLCGSDDGLHCNGAWSAGQLLFIDSNANHQHDENEPILRVFPRIQGHLEWQGFSGAVLNFSPTGFLFNQQGHFKLCHHTRGFLLTLNQIGRLREEAIKCQKAISFI